jgi:glycerol-3-phosphate dehydrogenase subunit B
MRAAATRAIDGGHVVVVGAGIAGTGAALAARATGLLGAVTLLDGGTGASTLCTGALDFGAWQQAASRPRRTEPIDGVIQALGDYIVPAEGAVVLTCAGIERPAAGYDAALLDVAPLPRGRIGVVRCPRAGWDADALAGAWGNRYVALSATVLRFADERFLPDTDFASRHDEDERLGWLADRLREAVSREGGPFCALVVPPALGVQRARAQALSAKVGLPCGEAIGMPGGPPGLRFECARRRALTEGGVEHRSDRARSIERQEGRWIVKTESGTAYEGHSVVLATGGLLGGGIEYAPSEAEVASVLPASARAAFRLAIQAPFALGADGGPFEAPGSLFGTPPESLGRPFDPNSLLERAGVLVDDEGASTTREAGLFAAGDVVADASRAWLASLAGGVRAGAAAARNAAQRGAATAVPTI